MENFPPKKEFFRERAQKRASNDFFVLSYNSSDLLHSHARSASELLLKFERRIWNLRIINPHQFMPKRNMQITIPRVCRGNLWCYGLGKYRSIITKTWEEDETRFDGWSTAYPHHLWSSSFLQCWERLILVCTCYSRHARRFSWDWDTYKRCTWSKRSFLIAWVGFYFYARGRFQCSPLVWVWNKARRLRRKT